MSNNEKFRMTIVVPVYNEAENLDRLKEVMEKFFPSATVKTKVLFVDDGSTDDSLAKIREICKDRDEFSYIKFKENCGLSTAIKAGIDYCQTELTGYIDADLQTTPHDLNKLLEYIDRYDAVIGYREKRKDGAGKKIQSLIANNIRRLLINDGIIDTGCPLKVMRSDKVKKIPFFKGMHRFIPALIQLYGGSVKQVKVRHFERVAGKSKFNMLNRAFKAFHDALAFRWMKSRYIEYEVDESDL